MMAATAKYRDDISGSITTAGSATAYTVTSFQIFDTLAHLAGQNIAFVPHATNTNTVGVDVTLNVDGLGAKPIRIQPSVALPNGSLVLGTPYIVTYNNVDSVFYLQNMTNPYNIPIAAGMDFWGTTAPNTSFAFPIGQAISRTTYATLFAIMSTTYGVGDGSTTFNLPDKTGRVSAMKEASATRLTSTYFGGTSSNLGAVGGAEANSVLITHNHGITDPSHTHTIVGQVFAGAGANGASAGATGVANIGVAPAITGITINNAGSAAAHNITQPTIICNYIIRII